MRVGIPKETFPGETRVAMVPAEVSRLKKKKIDILMERGAGLKAGYLDEAYEEKGATLVDGPEKAFEAEVIALIRGAGANPDAGKADMGRLGKDHTFIATMNPLGAPDGIANLAKTGATGLALELIPRITRAQSMDVLSSMANLAGYKAVLLGANHLAKILPMMTTAAGTLSPARVFVLGAGVAGLQAIATAKRLGAVVEAYDIRPEVAEQVQSVGGKFVDLGLETEDAGDSGGYAKAQSDDFYKRQQEALAEFIRASDMVITTAAIPGRKAPTLVTYAMMEGMKPGTVVVDLAAETGGNCEPTKAGEIVDHNGVIVVGPSNVPGTLPHHASQLFARNLSTFLMHIADEEGAVKLDTEDEITSGTLVCRGGDIANQRVKDALEKQG